MNNFTFNDQHFLQIHGTAMGTHMAPSYANLFMGKFEQQAIENATLSRLRRDCHACGLKTAISRLLTPAFPFLTPGGKVWAFTALTDSFWKTIIKYLNNLELMRENNDRTFAKSRILVGKATGDIVILV